MSQSLSERLCIIKDEIATACRRASRPADAVRLIAVTKTYPVETIQALIDLGVRDIGENKVQEMASKVPLLRGDFTMHLVGHLQTNKVNKVVGTAAWIQSVDSLRLLEKIERANEAAGKTINILIEVNTSGEASKSGCLPAETEQLFAAACGCRHLTAQGLMTIGPLTDNESAVRAAFERLRMLGERCCKQGQPFELSMGMSSDFSWAIAEGATMVRIGTRLLGERDYSNHSTV